MASYARRYQDAARSSGACTERPLRLTIGGTGQHDSDYRTLAETHGEAPAAFNDYLESHPRSGDATVANCHRPPTIGGKSASNDLTEVVA